MKYSGAWAPDHLQVYDYFFVPHSHHERPIRNEISQTTDEYPNAELPYASSLFQSSNPIQISNPLLHISLHGILIQVRPIPNQQVASPYSSKTTYLEPLCIKPSSFV
jgi:hypothetical protein